MILEQVRADADLSEEERAQAIEFFEQVPVSRLLVVDPEFAESFDSTTRFYFATFRWMIWLSLGSLIAGVVVFVLGGVSALCSLHSQQVQYLSLSVGWHVLRVFGAAQVIIQGVLLVALSFWVTALWFDIYVPKIILIVAVLALFAMASVIMAIFKRPEVDFAVEGELIPLDAGAPLHADLSNLCQQIGAAPPDQVIAGIDANFFVTEQAVTLHRIGDEGAAEVVGGRVLYVSLSLLKQLERDEAAAVMAHEMAHFSGQDTLYSKKISPLLIRYGNYLEALSEQPVALPVFYFMLCFRGLYELSLNRLSRQREFRADKIAAETVSPEALSGALLRIAAYAQYRGTVEQEVFDQEEVLDQADIRQRIEDGFHEYARGFLDRPEVGELRTTHPFDSHPPLDQRLAAHGFELDSDFARGRIAQPGDGGWFYDLPGGEGMERAQWEAYEQRFRDFHEEVLAYRYLPETPEQQSLVEKYFPEVAFEGKDGRLVLDHDKVAFAGWESPVHFHEVVNLNVDDNSVLHVAFDRDGSATRKVKLKKFGAEQIQPILDALSHYYSRRLAAAEHNKRSDSIG